MLKWIRLQSLAMLLCLGASCTIHINPDGDGDNDGQIFLDQTDASIVIGQQVGGETANVSATITDSQGRTVILNSDQAVEVNGVDLAGPDSDDKYKATVDAAGQYEITVVEPTRGIDETTIDAPADFEITSPAANGTVSLSGFTLEWSGANNRLQVSIKLAQTFEGTQTRTFGPFTDTGSREFTQQDLEAFGHGGDLTLNITVTKINTVHDINGFNSGTATVRVSAARVAKPGP